MQKLPIFGTPITPAHLLEELRGESFCVSFATKRDTEVARLRELVGTMLMLDNGAFSAWQKGGEEPFLRDEYLWDYETWALEQMELCDVAVPVVADTITGSTETNRALWKASRLPKGRRMVVFHMHESDAYLRELLASGESYLAFGSSGQYAKPGTPEWHARIAGMMAIVKDIPRASRPHIHMMRAQAQHHLYDFDSSDSTNLAVNHCRYKHTGAGYVRRFADRIHAKLGG